MDHIVENEGKPVPTDGGSSNEPARPSAGGDDDDEEDFKLAMSLSQGESGEQEAKVCSRYMRCMFELMDASLNAVYQVLGVWQGV